MPPTPTSLETRDRPAVTADIVEGPIPPPDPDDPHSTPPPGAGALLTFDGVVRPFENDRPIEALDYTAYLPMALTQLRRLAEDAAAAHDLSAIHALHSIGRVPVGACSFRLTVAAPHRADALAAMTGFVDRLKRDVPIWKSPVSA